MSLATLVMFSGRTSSKVLRVDPTGLTLPAFVVNKVYGIDAATGNIALGDAATSSIILGFYIGTDLGGSLLFEQERITNTAAFTSRGTKWYLSSLGNLSTVASAVEMGVAIDADHLEVTGASLGTGGGGGGAPTVAEYLLGVANGSLPNGRLPSNTATVSWDVTVANQFKANVIDGSITDAKLRNSAALSIIGRSTNTLGAPADIAAGSDFFVLRRSGVTLGFGQVETGGITNNHVTLGKLAQIADQTLLGNGSGGVANVTTITLASGFTLGGGVLDFTVPPIFGTVGILDDNIPVSDGLLGQTLKAGPINIKPDFTLKIGPGGTARGVGALDFQTLRSAGTDVASGARSALFNTVNSSCVGSDSGVYSSRASHNNAPESAIIAVNTGLIGGGGGYHIIAGGRDHTIGAPFFQSGIFAGHLNSLTFGSNSVILGGEEGDIQDAFSAIIAGYQNQITRSFAVAMGLQALADKVGMIAIGGGKISISGDRQAGMLMWSGSTPNATPVELNLLGQGGAFLTLINGDLYKLKVSALAISTGGNYAVWDDLPVVIHRFSGTTATDVDIATVAPLYENGMASARLALTADDVNDRGAVVVTGIGATVQWFVFGFLQKVSLT